MTILPIPLDSTGQYIAKTIICPAIGFAYGALYAVATNGPVVLTGCVSAIGAVAIFAIQGLLLALAKNNVISAKTYALLDNANIILCATALLVAGISLGIIGPVAITVFSIGIGLVTLLFLATLITPKDKVQFQHAL